MSTHPPAYNIHKQCNLIPATSCKK
jgi:hypothetical protein